MTEHALLRRINDVASRRHEIYALLADERIGMDVRDRLRRELETLQGETERLYTDVRQVRARDSHRAATSLRTSRRWPIVSMRDEPLPENVTPNEVVARRRQEQRARARQALGD